MLERIEHVLELVAKSRKDKTTMAMTIGAVVAFGVAVGAVAVYEHLAKKLDIIHSQPTHHISHEEEYEEDEYY